jgi:hypothetical protein
MKGTDMLDSKKFIEDDDRIMYVNDLSDGGIGFVIWNGDQKNVILITEDGKDFLAEWFADKERLKST